MEEAAKVKPPSAAPRNAGSGERHAGCRECGGGSLQETTDMGGATRRRRRLALQERFAATDRPYPAEQQLARQKEIKLPCASNGGAVDINGASYEEIEADKKHSDAVARRLEIERQIAHVKEDAAEDFAGSTAAQFIEFRQTQQTEQEQGWVE
jgi:hypothetical protein